MARNLGTSFEQEIERSCGTYAMNRIAKIHKCDPPTKVIGKKIIYIENPFPDFVGSWTEKNGRALVFEAKRTEKAMLAVSERSGLKFDQLNQLDNWARGGAFAALLWQHKGETRAMTVPQIRRALRESGRKSLTWDQASILPRGNGWVRYDFLLWARNLTG